IPRGLEPPPGYRAVARYEPAQVTSMGGQPVIMAGGDYYDLFKANDHTLVALVGDASGHGLKACMSIMTMHTLVRMLGAARFGVKGIIEALKSCRERSLEETLECLFESSHRYTGGAGRHDDTSALLLERVGQ